MENAGKQNLLQYTTTTNSIPFQNSHAFSHFFQHPPPAATSTVSGGGGGGAATTTPTTNVDMNHVCSSFSDPHFMCLNLGKRHYFSEAATATAGELFERPTVDNYNNYCLNKKGKVYDGGVGGGGGMVVVPRCQVDGCHVELGNAKEYHKRHKVCEVHAKAPIVVLFGIQQRFCQQCSRFHVVSEFDGSKRSCRRRLACHNERRRKSSQEHSAVQKHFIGNTEMMTRARMHSQMQMQIGCAHSLLSSSSKSNTSSSWIDSSSAAGVDLPSRCSTALRELIVKNRAAVLAQQLMLGNDLQTQGCNFHVPHQNEPDRPC